MKLLFTLLIFCLASLTVSAQTDTTKVMASVARLDSNRLRNELAANKVPVQYPVFVKYTESLNLATLTRSADSLRMEDSITEFNHLKMLAGERSLDSANYRFLVRQIDTIRSPVYAHNLDSLKQQFKTLPTDSLKQQLKLEHNSLYKGPINTEIAARYMDYDTLSNQHVRYAHQNQAINYTMQALHQYSYYNDTTGMRISFDALAKIYLAQKKYSQAKWFTLQSNTLSRIKKDVPNIIASLIMLATVKSDINDNDLAMMDLNEALQLSETNHMQKTESEVLRRYAMLYSRLKKYDKEAVVLKKRDSIEAAIQKQQDAVLLARLKTKDSTERTKADSAQAKKKVYTSNIKKLSKNNSAKRIASL